MSEFVNCCDCRFWMKAGDERHDSAKLLIKLKNSDNLGICAKHAPLPNMVMQSFTGSVIKYKHLTQGKFDKSSNFVSNDINTSYVFPVMSKTSGCFEGEKGNG